MYLEYFSLKRHPFRITPDPSLFFPGGTHGRGVVLDALVYGITTGEGILKVVGEVGSGKTMLCRMLEEWLSASIEIVYLANPNLTARDIVYAIAFELKLEVDSSTDRLLVMQKLQNYLLQKHSTGGSVVVFVEEAQGMPLETLEEIRLLSNLETHRHKLMQIVLFGQPELERKLQNRSIRQLRERITHSFDLDPLTPQDVREYLHFRLQQAGCPWPQLFSPNAEKMVAAASGGLTRRINILADKALLAAYADPAMRQEPRNSAGEILPMVLPRHVKTAIADSGYRRWQLPQLPTWLVYASTTVAVLVLVGLIALQSGWFAREPESVAAVPARAEPEIQQEVREVAQPTVQEQAPPVIGQAVEQARAQDVTPDAPASVAGVATPQTTAATTASVTTAASQTATATSASATDTSVAAQPAPPEAAAYTPATAQSLAPTGMTVPANLASTPAAEPPALTGNPPPVAATDATPADVSSGAPASAANSATSATAPAQTVEAVAPTPGSGESAAIGLAAQRKAPSEAWLAALPSKEGYTIQLFSVSTQQPEKLEEFLEFLALTNLLDRSYVCVISRNSRRPEQWLVVHDEFPGVSAARSFIRQLPAYLTQYQPYIRNLNDIACAQ
jgi:MSHA biogenesis protein MshM